MCLVPKRSTTRESGRRAVVGKKKRRNNQTETEPVFTKVEQQNRRERERERENWAQSNKIKQNFTKV